VTTLPLPISVHLFLRTALAAQEHCQVPYCGHQDQVNIDIMQTTRLRQFQQRQWIINRAVGTFSRSINQSEWRLACRWITPLDGLEKYLIGKK
jgi:hypothetical protein